MSQFQILIPKPLVKALDLSHCASRTVFPSVQKQRYSFPGEGSVDEFGLVVVLTVSPKTEINAIISPCCFK